MHVIQVVRRIIAILVDKIGKEIKPMISSKKSQSIIEFSVVVVLVLAGIILMGPSTIRGINAHFKSWQDSASDSMKDPLLPATEYPVPPDCGNGAVDPGETLTYCCQDFPMVDGDGVCCTIGGETAAISPIDCSYCGDNVCNGEETNTNCCLDCHGSPACGDGSCCTENGPSNSGGTPIDGDVGCYADCPWIDTCGNNFCGPNEDEYTCPPDCCARLRNNGVCNNDAPCYETIINTPNDCCVEYCSGHCGDNDCDVRCPAQTEAFCRGLSTDCSDGNGCCYAYNECCRAIMHKWQGSAPAPQCCNARYECHRQNFCHGAGTTWCDNCGPMQCPPPDEGSPVPAGCNCAP
ncbi:MAG: hypothetical protein WC676_01535 [Candidatus Omnitrophota bacterium]